MVEESAMKSLKEKIYAHKSGLLDKFQTFDVEKTGV